MDHYSTLGIDRSASPEDIKTAFKKLAMKHHPDRGGDAGKFQELNEAYSVLSDPEKRMMYDHGGHRQHHFNTQGGNPFGPEGYSFTVNTNGFQQHFNQGPFGGGGDPHFEEMLKNFGFGFAQQPRRNRDLNMRCQISLKDAYEGKNVKIDYRMPNGEGKSINVDVPPGIENGQGIKVNGAGDHSNKQLPPGDLTIVIEIAPVNKFNREELNLITETDISIFEAMIGCTKLVKNIDDTDVEIVIRPGTQHGQRYSCRGLGFPNLKFTNIRGDLHVIVNVKTPIVTNPTLVAAVNELANKLR
jgi:curved DNA-binding protein